MKAFKGLVVIFFSVLVALSSGTLFIYSVYVPQLATRCKLSASDTSNLTFGVTLGTAIGGFLAGILTDLKGTQLPIFLGGVSMSIGYRIIYLDYQKGETFHVMYTLMFAMLCIGMGSVSAYFATIKAVTLNFPEYKGTAQSIPIAFFAVASFFYSIVASKVYEGDVPKFLNFLSITVGLGCTVGCIFVKEYKEEEDEQSRDDYETATGSASATLAESDTDIPFKSRNNSHESQLLLDREDLVETPVKDGLFNILRSPLFLSHYAILGLIQGIGQMYIYSVGFIVKAQFYSSDNADLPYDLHDYQALHVSIISFMSFLGRLVSGPQSDIIVKRFDLPRIYNLFFGVFLLTLGQFLATLIDSISLRLCFVSATIGYAYGFLFGTYPSIVSDSFDMSQFSTVWGCLTTCSVITTSVMTRIFGEIYESNSVTNADGERICLKGIVCYRETFEITTTLGMILFALIIGVIYFHRK